MSEDPFHCCALQTVRNETSAVFVVVSDTHRDGIMFGWTTCCMFVGWTILVNQKAVT